MRGIPVFKFFFFWMSREWLWNSKRNRKILWNLDLPFGVTSLSTYSWFMWTTASSVVYPAAVKLSLYRSILMACSQSPTETTAENSGELGSSNAVLGLKVEWEDINGKRRDCIGQTRETEGQTKRCYGITVIRGQCALFLSFLLGIHFRWTALDTESHSRSLPILTW